MSNKEFETEVVEKDEIVDIVNSSNLCKHNSIWYTIVSGTLVPVIDSIATPYYKVKIIEAQERLEFNKMVADERKCRDILNTLDDIATRSNLPHALQEEIIKALLKELHKLTK